MKDAVRAPLAVLLFLARGAVSTAGAQVWSSSLDDPTGRRLDEVSSVLGRSPCSQSWRDGRGPLLQTLRLPLDELEARGWRPDSTVRRRAKAITLQWRAGGVPGYARVQIHASRQAAWGQLVVDCACPLSARGCDYEPREPPPGELVAADRSAGGTGSTLLAFGRANVTVTAQGPREPVDDVARWLDERIRAQAEGGPDGVTEVAEAHLLLVRAGAPERPAYEARPDPLPARDTVFRILEPRFSWESVAVVPEGTRNCRILVQVLDPHVEEISFGSTRVQVVGDTVIHDVALPYGSQTVYVSAWAAPVGDWNGKLAERDVHVWPQSKWLEHQRWRASLPGARR
jgi:hypothetical protein